MSPELIVGVAALVATFLTNQYLQRRVEREKLDERRREKIAPLMEELLGFIRRVGKQGVKDEDEATMARIQTGLLLWGSRPVVESWASWMRLAERRDVTNRHALDAMVDLIHTARAEFGHEDQGMAKRDLLRVYVNDIDTVFSKDELF